MLKILLIDDEAGIRKLLSISLRSEGYDVITAENGKRGIELFEQEAPSIVLTDIKMPGTDGIGVLRRIKEINPETEVIVITGDGDMKLAVKSLQLDASDFITKPISEEALSVALKRAEEKLKIKKRLKNYTYNLEKAVKEKTGELEKSYKEMESLCDITRRTSEKKSLGEAFDFIIDQTKNILSFEEMAPLILNKEKKGFVKVNGYRELSVEDREGLVSAIALMRHPMNIDELSASGYPWLKSFDGYESISLVPIIKEDEVIGVVILLAAEHIVFSRKDLRFLYLMLSQVAGIIRRIALNNEKMKELENKVKMFSGYGGIVGKDHKMRQLYKLILDIAPTDATVMIQGESGSGKELVARAVHLHSYRKDKPFIVVNCSAYPQTLLESELFGHEKGAFTGAIHRKLGRFELADKGTLFLDEIGEIPLMSQVKLLRFLQFQKFERSGGMETIEVDIRVIAATNKDLKKEVENGNFREDLYYRLNVIPINIPPLRVRRNDISLLVEHFLKRLNLRGNKKVKGISSEAMDILMRYNWPGNVRELENIIEHAFILTKEEFISGQSLPLDIYFIVNKEQKISSFQENEKKFLARVLEEYKWNKLQVAKKLNISRSTLYAKLKKYNIHSSK
ncbi:MAG: sigma 54-interacting transcriptional regulator [Deltaproteobacteria bacterium]|jgi:two-component system response regulator HydG|nr:sigma 54-interacting transcriptional regulator [Deltaproteobacteria bacterium]